MRAMTLRSRAMSVVSPGSRRHRQGREPLIAVGDRELFLEGGGPNLGLYGVTDDQTRAAHGKGSGHGAEDRRGHIPGVSELGESCPQFLERSKRARPTAVDEPVRRPPGEPDHGNGQRGGHSGRYPGSFLCACAEPLGERHGCKDRRPERDRCTTQQDAPPKRHVHVEPARRQQAQSEADSREHAEQNRQRRSALLTKPEPDANDRPQRVREHHRQHGEHRPPRPFALLNRRATAVPVHLAGEQGHAQGGDEVPRPPRLGPEAEARCDVDDLEHDLDAHRHHDPPWGEPAIGIEAEEQCDSDAHDRE